MAEQDAVTVKRQGGWSMSMDGTTETRVSFGSSTKGHHFAIEKSYLGGEDANSDAKLRWSRPYATEAQAERVAGIRESLASGDRLPSPREALRDRASDAAAARGTLPAAEAARSLSTAATFRSASANQNPGVGETYRSHAREAVEKSRGVTQASSSSGAASYWRDVASAASKDKPGEAAGAAETQRRARGLGAG